MKSIQKLLLINYIIFQKSGTQHGPFGGAKSNDEIEIKIPADFEWFKISLDLDAEKKYLGSIAYDADKKCFKPPCQNVVIKGRHILFLFLF